MADYNSSCACHEGGEHGHKESNTWYAYWREVLSLSLLLAGIAFDNWAQPAFFHGTWRLAWYLAAYIPVGFPVIRSGIETLVSAKSFFTEYTLMVVATIGAFVIGQYAEGVAVMLFYAVGELFQDAAVSKARRSIESLVELCPQNANVLQDGQFVAVDPRSVEAGATILVRAGEKVPLDGLLEHEGHFNTAALTGESIPQTIPAGGSALAGMINAGKPVKLRTTHRYEDSSLSRIMEMVQNAVARKAPTELLIRSLARVYTPIVFMLAVLLVVVPYFIVTDYIFADWLYRGLVFLVVSCPCALVISIPLGYFGGIGAASRLGILFKGSNWLDVMAKVNTVVMDKTGTVTEGIFRVTSVVPQGMDEDELAGLVAALERHSTHPVARAVVEYANNRGLMHDASQIEEIAGMGLRGAIDGRIVLAGNTALLQNDGIAYDIVLDGMPETIVACAVDGKYAGYISIADSVKHDSAQAVKDLRRAGVQRTVMLSGDKDAITRSIARSLGIDEAFGGLLPEDKVRHVERLREEPGQVVAFVGDGINDSPVLASSNIGIAMGAMGSDAAIETADVVIQTDRLPRVATAIHIGRATHRVVMQNIVLALAFKGIVLIVGALGYATMWEAVFADVGVALLAILNSMRIQRMRFDE